MKKKDRQRSSTAPDKDAPDVLKDPLDKLSTIALVHDPTVDDLLIMPSTFNILRASPFSNVASPNTALTTRPDFEPHLRLAHSVHTIHY